MDRASTLADPPPGPALGASRARVLTVLQQARGPLVVSEVAEQVGLHTNTARFHLDALVELRLADRESEERDVPGRPRSLYTASAESANVGQRSYRLLAEILASYLAAQSTQPGSAAREAGEAWGRRLAEPTAPSRRVSTGEATSALVEALDGIGFAPEAVTKGRQRQILLHQCPFREAAEQNQDVVCAVHLGLMRGMLAEIGAPLDADRLDPFVEPNLCVTHLGRRAPDQAHGTASS